MISPTDGMFDWILGGHFQRNEIDVSIVSLEAGFPTEILPVNRPTTTGFFAQTSYALSDALELQAGARYSTYEATGAGGVFIGNGIPGFPPGGLPVANLSGSHDEGRATGKVALNWTLDSDNLVYVFAARGYKPGGFDSVDWEFDPEIVLNYEAGWKSTFLEARMRTQVAIFQRLLGFSVRRRGARHRAGRHPQCRERHDQRLRGAGRSAIRRVRARRWRRLCGFESRRVHLRQRAPLAPGKPRSAVRA